MIKFVAVTSSMVASNPNRESTDDESENELKDTTDAVAKALHSSSNQLSNSTDPNEEW